MSLYESIGHLSYPIAQCKGIGTAPRDEAAGAQADVKRTLATVTNRLIDGSRLICRHYRCVGQINLLIRASWNLSEL